MKNRLFVLAFLSFSFFIFTHCRAENKFFDEGFSFFEGVNKTSEKNDDDECCDKEETIKTIKFKESKKAEKYVEEIKKRVLGKMKRNNLIKKSIYLFITPSCSFNKQAVNTLKEFKLNNSSWDTSVIVIGSVDEFFDFIKKNKEMFKSNIPFKHDIQNKYADKFEINEVPGFVFSYRGYYKTAGQPDLEKTVLKLGKT